MGEEELQQRIALGRLQFVDAGGEAIADEQALAPGDRMGAHHRMRARRILQAGLLQARQVGLRDAEALAGKDLPMSWVAVRPSSRRRSGADSAS